MKFIKISLKILLPLFLIITSMSFIAESTVVKTFSDEILAKKVSGYFLDEIIYDIDTNSVGKIEEKIRKSKYTDKITSKFIENIVGNLLNGSDKVLDITNEVDILISENMPESISEEKVKNTKKYLIRKITNTEKRLEENLLHSFGDYYLVIFKAYDMFTNIHFRYVMLALCIMDIIFLIMLEKYNTLKSIQISTLITAIFSSAIFVAIKLLSNLIDQKLAGGWLSSINLNLMMTFIILEFIISFVLLISAKKIKLQHKLKNRL